MRLGSKRSSLISLAGPADRARAFGVTTNVWDFENQRNLVALPSGERVTTPTSAAWQGTLAMTTYFAWDTVEDNIVEDGYGYRVANL